MATQLYIPDEVIRDIQNWARQAELAAIADYPQTSKDEDAIVESLGTRLRCRTRVVDVTVEQVNGRWRWSISHTRFGGRGRGAAEKQIGSDVIIQMVLRQPDRFQVDKKCLLIQAKKNWKNDPKIMEQAAKLSTWREAVAVMNLTAQKFEAFVIDDVIGGRGQRPSKGAVQFSTFFARQFVGGELGDESLLYDARRELLQWLDMKDTLVQCPFRCNQKIVITITAPVRPGPWDNPALIDVGEVHQHRLKASSSEILGVPVWKGTSAIKTSYRRMQHLYHVDKHTNMADDVKDAMNRRSQEINQAYNDLKRDG
jgi:hypothetical protein